MGTISATVVLNLLPWMERILPTAKRFNVLAKGRRAGGSSLCEDLAVDVAAHGYPVGWFSASDKLLSESWERFSAALAGMTARKNEQKRRLDLHGGGVIECWSCESRITTRSRKYYMAVIDEAAHVPDLERNWTQEIRPSLMDLRGGAWFPSSPNGNNYFRTLWQQGQDPAFTDWQSWQIPTWENPLIAPEEIESMRQEMSEISYRQEVCAEFVSLEGAVFGDFRRERHVRPVQLNDRLDVMLGIDFGYRTFAVSVVQVDKQGMIRIVGEAEWKNLTTDQAIDRLKQYHWWDMVRVIACDPAGDAVNIQGGISDVQKFREAFQDARVCYSMAPHHRDPEWRASRIRDLLWSAAGTSRIVVSPDCKGHIAMFELSQYPKAREGSGEKAVPVKDGKIDHVRDAFGYLLVNTVLAGQTTIGSRRPY